MSDVYIIKRPTQVYMDCKLICDIVDSLPRKEFETHDREARKANFEVPDKDVIDDGLLKLFEMKHCR